MSPTEGIAEQLHRDLSRRALLVGAGGLAGAVALATAGGTAAAVPPPLTPDDPSLVRARLAQQAGFPPLGVVPGVHYRAWSYHEATPASWSNGRIVNSNGAACQTSGVLRIGLGLEAGIAVTEATFAAQNSSGTSAIAFLDRLPFDGSSPTQITSVTIPSGLSNVQVVSKAVANAVIGDAESVTAGMGTFGPVRLFGFRLGFIPFGFGYTPIAPKRVYDSRAGNPPLGVTKGPLSNGTRVINLLNGVTLPAGVKPVGLLVNLAVVNTSASGFLSLYENGKPDPQTSSINWFTANEIVANTTYTAVDATGQAVAKVPANASTDFFIDVVGYYA
ncbi:MAG: hypothetical protein U0Q07_04280 [Acidimicrobiales bacterium]